MTVLQNKFVYICLVCLCQHADAFISTFSLCHSVSDSCITYDKLYAIIRYELEAFFNKMNTFKIYIHIECSYGLLYRQSQTTSSSLSGAHIRHKNTNKVLGVSESHEMFRLNAINFDFEIQYFSQQVELISIEIYFSDTQYKSIM